MVYSLLILGVERPQQIIQGKPLNIGQVQLSLLLHYLICFQMQGPLTDLLHCSSSP